MTEPVALEYTLPGVLHYLQTEWRRFERERNEWTIERAEFKARIALLEGERRGIENSKHVLMKRVKMLEYALRQERKTYTREETETIITNENHNTAPSENIVQDEHNSKLKEKSKKLLTSCLEEINYLTSIPTKLPLTHALSSSPVKLSRADSTKKTPVSNQNSKSIAQQSSSPKKDNNLPKEKIQHIPENVDEVAMMNNKVPDNKEVPVEIQEKFHISEENVIKIMKNANKGSKEHSLADNLNSHQSRETLDERQQKNNQPKVWKNRATIRGHLDSVRTVSFHSKEMMAASGSDDGTVKIWNLKRLASKDGRKSGLEEADPNITFRGHTSVVTSVMISSEQNRVYSSSLDSTIRAWRLPPDESGPFSPVDLSLNLLTYVGHTDAIWDFKLSPFDNLLASASSDGTIKLWDTRSTGSLLKSTWTFDGIYNRELSKEKVPPTSLDFCQSCPNKLIASFSNAKIRLYDIETGQPIITMRGSDETYDTTQKTQINRVLAHPTLPLVFSAHEDKHIKVFDIKSGECVKTLSGHLDGVTSLDIDSTSNTLVSGGHDSSIRLWNLNTFANEQEISAHRRKGDEGVLSVKFHPSHPWMLSGGADGIIKVYHFG